jgi:hypothetical protein
MAATQYLIACGIILQVPNPFKRNFFTSKTKTNKNKAHDEKSAWKGAIFKKLI